MRTVLNFNSNWSFLKDSKDVPAQLNADWEVVTLPHTWNAVDGMDGGNDYFRGTCCYAKTLTKAELPRTIWRSTAQLPPLTFTSTAST